MELWCAGDWDAGCVNNEVEIAMPATEPVNVLWEDMTGGEPIDTVDPTELLGILWKFNCGAEPCTIDLTLDDIAFMQP
jgi:hypothetical protein